MEGNKELERAKEILCTYVVFYIIKIYDKMHACDILHKDRYLSLINRFNL